jgi:hypothetical protein
VDAVEREKWGGAPAAGRRGSPAERPGEEPPSPSLPRRGADHPDAVVRWRLEQKVTARAGRLARKGRKRSGATSLDPGRRSEEEEEKRGREAGGEGDGGVGAGARTTCDTARRSEGETCGAAERPKKVREWTGGGRAGRG